MGVMINLDCSNFYHSRANVAGSLDEMQVRKHIGQYKNTGVTDVLLNVGAWTSVTPSKIRTTLYESCKAAEEHFGEGAGGSCYPVLKRLHEIGLDEFEVWMDEATKNNINAWLSFRMNDAHNLDENDNPLIPPEFKEKLKTWSVVRHHRRIGWFDGCRDFELEGVRREQLDYIEEQIMRYLPYGIELDFQRELNCFRTGYEWSGMEIMTDFMKNVKKIVARAEEKAGRKIKILVRCNQNPQYCMEWGFDIIRWAAEGLIDAFAPAPRWNCTDTDIPIKLWKQILAPYNIPVYPGIDAQNIHPSPEDFKKKGHTVCTTVETTFGIAANLLTQGADGIYLFNYFNEVNDETITDENRELGDGNDIYSPKGYYKILALAGNYDEAIQQKRKHMITYNDKEPLYRKNDAVLPLVCGGKYDQTYHSNGECNPRYLRFATGTIPDDKKCKVRFRINTEGFDVNNVEIYVNCYRTEFAGIEEQGEPYCGAAPLYGESNNGITPDVYTFKIPREAIQPEIQVAEILLKEGKEENLFIIDYADLIVE